MEVQANHNQYFHVEGVRCARCIHAIETALKEEQDVIEARVNMSTSRLSVSWDGADNRALDFINIVKSLGYGISPFQAVGKDDSKSKTEDQKLLMCMAVAGFAMGNIMIISVALWSVGQEIMGIATRDFMHIISGIIAIPAVAYAGRPFFSSALNVLKKGHTNMDVPISLAIILAIGMSIFETYNHGEHAYFDSAVMLVFFLLIGRWLDARARGKARQNAEDLLAMMSGYANVIKDGVITKILISDLTPDMNLRISVGEKIPTDSIIISGHSEIDTSLVTGETLPINVKEGDQVFGGTLNLSAPLTCKVLKASEDSLLADIIRLMEQAEQGRAEYVRLADKAAKLYTPVVHSLALIAFIGWYFIGGIPWQDALLISITTLIITCPCALGLAVPVVQVLASSWLMKRGILLKSGDALERLSKITSIVFDKTGTLTLGTPHLIGEFDPEKLKIAASLASHSNHPYSKAITKAYNGSLYDIEEIEEIVGTGVKGKVNGQTYQLGKIDPRLHETMNKVESTQRPMIWLSTDASPEPYAFYFDDPLREDSTAVLNYLHSQKLKAHLLSGDRVELVEQVGKALKIDTIKGALLPQDKTKFIKALQEQGEDVLMVGDGLNDAPSLAQANISISPSTGVDITQNTADIVFRGDKLGSIIDSYTMAKLSTKLVKQNFLLAVLYNCFAIPIALAGYVTPLIAAIAMSSSSLIVIANSFRTQKLKEFK